MMPKDSEIMLQGDSLDASCNALSSLDTHTVWFKVQHSLPGFHPIAHILLHLCFIVLLFQWPENKWKSPFDSQSKALCTHDPIFRVEKTDNKWTHRAEFVQIWTILYVFSSLNYSIGLHRPFLTCKEPWLEGPWPPQWEWRFTLSVMSVYIDFWNLYFILSLLDVKIKIKHL